jgi:hypothetical protein
MLIQVHDEVPDSTGDIAKHQAVMELDMETWEVGFLPLSMDHATVPCTRFRKPFLSA